MHKVKVRRLEQRLTDHRLLVLHSRVQAKLQGDMKPMEASEVEDGDSQKKLWLPPTMTEKIRS